MSRAGSTADGVSPMRFALLLCALIGAQACNSVVEDDFEAVLDPAAAGLAIECEGESSTARWKALQDEGYEVIGFSQPAGSRCALTVSSPRDATMTFGLRLVATPSRPEHEAAVTIVAETDTAEVSVFEDRIRPARTSMERSIDLPPGLRRIRFEVGSDGSTASGPLRVRWSDLELRSPGHDGDPADGWSMPIERAISLFSGRGAGEGETLGRRKLLVIGIDGASWDLIDRLARADAVPNIAALRARGVHGTLRSTIIPESAMAWSAVRTGVNPGKSRLFHFRMPDTKRRSYWDTLAEAGLDSIVLAVPKLAPDPASRAIIVGGWTYSRADEYARPPALLQALRRTAYDPGLVVARNPKYYRERMRERTELAVALMRSRDWDHAFVVYEYSDTVGHRFGLFTEEWEETYRHLDRRLGELLAAAGDQTTIILVSDHGWRRYSGSVDIEAWLRANDIDGWKTNMFSGSFIGLGIAAQQDAPSTRLPEAKLGGMLRELADPATGSPVVKDVHEAEAVFTGPYARSSPARIIVELMPGFHAVPATKRTTVIESSPIDHHDRDGLYVIASPDLPPGPGGEASVYDVAPTILSFFGIEPPADWDGRTIHRFETPTVERSMEPRASEATAGGEESGGEESPQAPVSEEVEEKLRALGYIQ